MIDAFHLPALRGVPTTSRTYGEVELRIPRLTPALVREQARALGEARARGLEHRPVAEIVAVIDRVAARLLDPADELRMTAERALPAITRYSPVMVRRELDPVGAGWGGGAPRGVVPAGVGVSRALGGLPAGARPRGRGGAA